MYDSFIDQLNGLDLSGLSIRPAPFNQTDFPCEDAIEQTKGNHGSGRITDRTSHLTAPQAASARSMSGSLSLDW